MSLTDGPGAGQSRATFAFALVSSDVKQQQPLSAHSTWLIDSGAAHHFSPYVDIFASGLHELEQPVSVLFGNGARCLCTKGGAVTFEHGGQVYRAENVIYCPEVVGNLFSVEQAMASGARVDGHGHVLDIIFDSEHVLHGRRQDSASLFTFEASPVGPPPSTSFSLAAAAGSHREESTDSANPSGGSSRSLTDAGKLAALWHARLGHLGVDSMQMLLGVSEGVNFSAKGLAELAAHGCDPCELGKGRRQPFAKVAEEKATAILERLSVDLCGPFAVTSRGGNRYLLGIIDEFSSFSGVFPIASKDAAAETIQVFIAAMENQLNRRVRFVRSDGGGEFVNNSLKAYYQGKGILQEITMAYSPMSNGKVERLWGTLIPRVRAMLLDAGLPPVYWAEAATHANWLRNRSPLDSGSTPYQLLYGKVPDLSGVRVWGCKAFAHVPGALRTKLQPTAQLGIHLGFSADHKGWKVLLSDGRIVNSRDVRFFEDVFPGSPGALRSGDPVLDTDSSDAATGSLGPVSGAQRGAPIAEVRPQGSVSADGDAGDGVVAATGSHNIGPKVSLPAPVANAGDGGEGEQVQEDQELGGAPDQAGKGQPSPPRRSSRLAEKAVRAADRPPPVPQAAQRVPRAARLPKGWSLVEDIESHHPSVARSHKEVDRYQVKWKGFASDPTYTEPAATFEEDCPLLVERYWDEQVDSAAATGSRRAATALAAAGLHAAPSLIAAAGSHSDSSAWYGPEPESYTEAMRGPEASKWREAMAAEMANHQANQTWVLGKPPTDAKVIPLRWVFKRKLDSAGAVSSYKARVVVKGFHQREGLDYDEVFAPTARLDSVRALLATAAARGWNVFQLDITAAFLNAPVDHVIWVTQPEGFVRPGGLACLLKKSLYGLKQAPRAWHEHFTAELKRFSKPSTADPCLYRVTRGKEDSFLTFHVDDVLGTGPDASNRANARLITAAFKARDQGEAGQFVGIKLTKDEAAGTYKLSQPRLAAEAVGVVGIPLTASSGAVPLQPALRLTKIGGTALSELQAGMYRSAVGKLMYLVTGSRPDLAYSVGQLARYMSTPTTEHWAALKSVLRYVAGTLESGLVYGPEAGDPVAYSDADYASDLDTRRSITGSVFLLSGAAVSWSSKIQHSTALSTAEAELMACADTGKQALWMRQLLLDLGWDVPSIRILVDNQATVAMLKNQNVSNRSKHIDVRYFFLREHIEGGSVIVDFVSTHSNVADLLTKALPVVKFSQHVRGMGMQ
jgi:hypothetical protein